MEKGVKMEMTVKVIVAGLAIMVMFTAYALVRVADDSRYDIDM